MVGTMATGGCSVVGYPAPAPAEAPEAGSDRPADVAPVPAVEPLSRYGNPPVYEEGGRSYETLRTALGYEEVGLASWYGRDFAGRRTSSGETFDPSLMTAAHRTLPLPTWVEVTHLETGRRVRVRVNDRGPFHDPDRRIIDLSREAARRLGMLGAGVAPVRVRVLAPSELADGAGGSGLR